MNCPNIEEIIRFASQTPVKSDANLAAHIYNCSACLKLLSIAICLYSKFAIYYDII